MPKYLPRVIHKYPWWWKEFLEKLSHGEAAYAIKGDKGDRGDKGDKGGSGGLATSPPRGCFKIVNFYIDADGNPVIDYDDTPIP